MAEKPNDIYRVTARPRPNGRRVLIVTDDKVHDLEFFYPYYRLNEEGYTVDVATPRGSDIKGEFGMKFNDTVHVDDVEVQYYDLLYIPGGKAPASLRKQENVLALARAFVEAGKPVAAFCHGPQVLVSAELVRGKRLAGWPGIEDEILKAGGIFVNEPVVKDGPFITSRYPADLPANLNAVVERLKQVEASERNKVA